MQLDGFPYRSQLAATASGPYDCGQASLLMMLVYFGFVAGSTTVDELSARVPGTTDAYELVKLANDPYEMPLVYDRANDPEHGLKAILGCQHPAIVLVNYLDLGFPPHLSTPDQGEHWLVIVGYDGDDWIVHDPLWRPTDRDGRGGAYLPLPAANLRAGYRGWRLYHARAAHCAQPAARSKLGVHVAGPARDGYGEFVKARPALIKSVDDWGAFDEPLADSPEMALIARTRKYGDTPPGNWSGDPIMVATFWMMAILDECAALPAQVYIEHVNEPRCDNEDAWRWLDAFTRQCIHVTADRGRRLCLYNFAAGNPPLEAWPLLFPSMELGKAHGAILGYHAYPIADSSDGTVFDPRNGDCLYRYRTLHTMLSNVAGEDVQVAITEMGSCWGNHQWDACGEEAWLEGVYAFDVEVRKDPYVLGFAPFTLGQRVGEWAGANFDRMMPQLTARLRESGE